MTIYSALELFNEDNKRKMLAPATLNYYNDNLSRFTEWLIAGNCVRVKQINSIVIDGYKLHLSQSVSNRTSVNTYLRAVRRFVNFLISKHEIKPIKITLLKDGYKIKSTFTNEEVERILTSVDPHDDTSVIMLMLLSTGMRSRSLCTLRVHDINFADGYVDLKHTKSGVPLCPPLSGEVLDCLKDYITLHGLAAADFLFRTQKGVNFNRNSLAERIKRRLTRLHIDKSGVHIFRHTFGKIMSMNGCPTAVLQKWLGHSDIRITQRYVDLYSNDLRNTMNLLPTSCFVYR